MGLSIVDYMAGPFAGLAVDGDELPRHAAPPLGHDADAILARGFSAARIAALRQARVI
jgi:hypothetical protein